MGRAVKRWPVTVFGCRVIWWGWKYTLWRRTCRQKVLGLVRYPAREKAIEYRWTFRLGPLELSRWQGERGGLGCFELRRWACEASWQWRRSWRVELGRNYVVPLARRWQLGPLVVWWAAKDTM